MHVDERKVQQALLDLASDIEEIKQTGGVSRTLKEELILVKVGQRQILMNVMAGAYAS
jgi:hypothetical protein